MSTIFENPASVAISISYTIPAPGETLQLKLTGTDTPIAASAGAIRATLAGEASETIKSTLILLLPVEPEPCMVTK